MGHLLTGYTKDFYYVFEPFKPESDDRDKIPTLLDLINCSMTPEYLNFIENTALHIKKLRVLPGSKGRRYQPPAGYFSGIYGKYYDGSGRDAKLDVDGINSKCRESSFIAIKILRMDFNLIREMLSKIPTRSLKQISLVFSVRDPRATLHSRQHERWCTKNCTNIRNICQNIERDYNIFTELSVKYPGMLHFIRYEDMCNNPSLLLPKLLERIKHPHYKSAKLDWFIKSRTKNSRLLINRWSQSFSAREISAMDKECSNVISILKYKRLQDMSAIYSNASSGDWTFPIDYNDTWKN